MSITKRKILSRWAEMWMWKDCTKYSCINCGTDSYLAILEMKIADKNGKKFLQFCNCPYRDKAFYVDSLKEHLSQSEHEEFCIFSGIVNKYPACYVMKSDVLRYLEDCQ